MISCTEFIWCYNELFRFLHDRHGKEDVIDLWRSISEGFLGNLEALVQEKGTHGMHEYWTHTLTEEGAEHVMTVTDDKFIIDMHGCPSVRLLREGPVNMYDHYCEHCAWLYPPILERFGFDVRMDVIDQEEGLCRLTVRRR